MLIPKYKATSLTILAFILLAGCIHTPIVEEEPTTIITADFGEGSEIQINTENDQINISTISGEPLEISREELERRVSIPRDIPISTGSLGSSSITVTNEPSRSRFTIGSGDVPDEFINMPTPQSAPIPSELSLIPPAPDIPEVSGASDTSVTENSQTLASRIIIFMWYVVYAGLAL